MRPIGRKSWFSIVTLIGILLLLGATMVMPVGAAKPFQGETITLLYFDATYAEAARAVIPEFENLTGAKVQLVTAPYQSLYEKEFTNLVTGAGGYDVMQVAYQWDGQFAPYFEPLDNYLAKSKVTRIKDFIPGVARACGQWDGKLFGIPNAADAYGVIYRTDVFKAAGINVTADWTWDDYAQTVKKLTKGGMYGGSIAGAKEQLDAFWTARYWGLGGHLMSQDWKTALPQRDLAVKALKMIIELKDYMPPGVMSYNIPDENAAFVHGKVASAELWPSLIRGEANDPTRSEVVGKWSILPYPGAHPQLSAWSLAIPNTSKNKALVWAWIEFYTSEENQRSFLEKFGIGPTRTAIYKDASVIKKHPDFPSMLISLEGVRPRFRIAQSQEAFDFLDERLNDALTGKLSPEEAIDQVAKFWEKIITPKRPKTPYDGDYVSADIDVR